MNTPRGHEIRDADRASRRGVIVAIVETAVMRARVAAAVDGEAELVFVRDVTHFCAAIQTLPAAIGVVDASIEECSIVAAVAAIHRAFPTLPLLALCDVARSPSTLVVDLVRVGVSGLLHPQIDQTRHAFRQALSEAAKSAGAERIYAEIAPCLSVSLRPLLRYALTRPHEDASVEDAAHSLGEDRKTLRNRLIAIGGPSPREFLAWAQLTLGGFLLESAGRTAEQVALLLGFGSGTAFRNMLQRYCGMTVAELREAGGGEFMLGRFRQCFAGAEGLRSDRPSVDRMTPSSPHAVQIA